MVRIWDNHNKQWLRPMSIIFGRDGEVAMVSAVKPGDEPLKDGWYKLEGDDLKKISISGDIQHNPDLWPPDVDL